MNYLFVFDSSIIPAKIRPDGLSSDDKVYLFPLTSQSSLTLQIKGVLEGSGADVETMYTGTLLNNRSDKIRAKYIRFVAELPQKVKTGKGDLKEWFSVDKDTSLWWFSLIAEKSTCKSEAFNVLAQLDSIVDTITEKKIGSIMFACGSGRLANALSEYSRENYIVFKTMPTVFAGGMERRIRDVQRMFYLKHVMMMICFAMRGFFTSWRIKRRLGRVRGAVSMKDRLIAVTYYPNIDLSLARRGIFRDKYYSFLQEGMESNGREMTWVAMYERRSSVPFGEALGYVEKFIKSGYHIFFLEEFCSFRDHVRTFLTILASGIKFLRIEKNIRDVHMFSNYNF
jgi:surface carbohydrate biosynthesis protein (TIGR04326 family)